MEPNQSANDIIKLLNLVPHPEGGAFIETFRDSPDGGRGYSTAIYFLLKRGQISEWHRVKDAAELWHFYGGSPLELTIAESQGMPHKKQILGMNLMSGERPQIVVPRNQWQMARPLGDWTLVGCTVAPSFVFDQFEMAPQGWSP
eukprot:gene16950-20163_t